MKITTNNIPRDLLEAWELTPTEIREFDYLDWEAINRGEASAQFFRYRGSTYDLGEFEWTGHAGYPKLIQDWHGIQTDSYFSGIVIKYLAENEQVIVGRFLS